MRDSNNVVFLEKINDTLTSMSRCIVVMQANICVRVQTLIVFYDLRQNLLAVIGASYRASLWCDNPCYFSFTGEEKDVENHFLKRGWMQRGGGWVIWMSPSHSFH